MKKIKVIFDKNKRSLKIKSNLLKILSSRKYEANVCIVIGGDGFMLQTLKEQKFKKIFLWN